MRCARHTPPHPRARNLQLSPHPRARNLLLFRHTPPHHHSPSPSILARPFRPPSKRPEKPLNSPLSRLSARADLPLLRSRDLSGQRAGEGGRGRVRTSKRERAKATETDTAGVLVGGGVLGDEGWVLLGARPYFRCTQGYLARKKLPNPSTLQ